MRRLRAVATSPYATGILATILVIWEAFWLLGPPVGINNSNRQEYLSWGLAALVVAFTANFINQQRRIRAYERTFEPRVTLVFDPLDTRYAQPGTVDRRVVGGNQICQEYRYALGVVNLSPRPITGCRLILAGSEPHNTSMQRLEMALRVRNDPNTQSAGEFTVPPGDSHLPTAFIEVLQELVPQSELHEPADIRLTYANTGGGQANWFHRRDHVLTFRLQGDIAQPVYFKLSVRYDDQTRRFIVRSLNT